MQRRIPVNCYIRVDTEIDILSKGSSARRLLISVEVTYLLSAWQAAQRQRECITGSIQELWEPGLECKRKSTSDDLTRLNTNVLVRGGTFRSSVEGPVMGLKRRESVTRLGLKSQLKAGG